MKKSISKLILVLIAGFSANCFCASLPTNIQPGTAISSDLINDVNNQINTNARSIAELSNQLQKKYSDLPTFKVNHLLADVKSGQKVTAESFNIRNTALNESSEELAVIIEKLESNALCKNIPTLPNTVLANNMKSGDIVSAVSMNSTTAQVIAQTRVIEAINTCLVNTQESK